MTDKAGDRGTGNSVLPFVVYLGTVADDTRAGGSGHDTLAGEGGEDTLFGLDGNDTMLEASGDGTVFGDDGNDLIFGDDTIFASIGDGADAFNGGDDIFVFNAAAAASGNTIEGFQPGDTIDLSPLYDSLNLGIPGGFEIVPNFTAAGQLKLHVVDSDTIIEGNTDNDNDVDFSIKIAGRTNLTSGDFG